VVYELELPYINLPKFREAIIPAGKHHLEKTALPATDISFLVGFDEPNSFYPHFAHELTRH